MDENKDVTGYERRLITEDEWLNGCTDLLAQGWELDPALGENLYIIKGPYTGPSSTDLTKTSER